MRNDLPQFSSMHFLVLQLLAVISFFFLHDPRPKGWAGLRVYLAEGSHVTRNSRLNKSDLKPMLKN